MAQPSSWLPGSDFHYNWYAYTLPSHLQPWPLGVVSKILRSIWLLVYTTTCQISRRSTPHSGLGILPRTHDLTKPREGQYYVHILVRVHEGTFSRSTWALSISSTFLSLPTFLSRLFLSPPTLHSRFQKSFFGIMSLLILLISITFIRSTLAATADQWRGRSIYQYCPCSILTMSPSC